MDQPDGRRGGRLTLDRKTLDRLDCAQGPRLQRRWSCAGEEGPV